MADRVIKFKGEFDASQILQSLKQIRSSMEQSGADPSLFKNIDKDLSRAEGLVTQMSAKIKSGFSNVKEVNNFERQISNLNDIFNQIGEGLSSVNIAENFTESNREIIQLRNQLQAAQGDFERIKQAAVDFTEEQKNSRRFTKAQAAEIQNAIENEENLLEVVQKINKERSKKAISSISTNLTKNQSQETISAMSQTILTGVDSSSLLGTQFFENTEDIETYREILNEVLLTGRELSQTEGWLELSSANEEITQSSEFIQGLIQDLGTLASAAADTGNELGANINKGNIGRQANILSSSGIQTGQDTFVSFNTQPYEELQQRQDAIAESTASLHQRIAEINDETQLMVANTNSGLEGVNQHINSSSDAWQDETQRVREATESQKEFEAVFDNLENTVRQVFSLGNAYTEIRQVIAQTYEDVKELDKSFAEIAMVTDYSVSDMWKQYDNYAEMANKLGQTTQSVIQASGLYYQQGLLYNK